MRSTASHNTNTVTEVLQELKAVKERVHTAMIIKHQEQEEVENITPKNHENYAGQPNEDQTQIIAFLRKLQEEVTSLQISKQGNGSNQRKRKCTDKYCCNHGPCVHTSKECKPNHCKPGHIE